MTSNIRYLSAWPNTRSLKPANVQFLRNSIAINAPLTVRAYKSHIEIATCCTDTITLAKAGLEAIGAQPYYIILVDRLPRPETLNEALALYSIYIRASRYWEAHEVLEEHWRSTTGTARSLIQGLIKAAATLAKAGEGSREPALRIARNASSLLGIKADCLEDAVDSLYFYGAADLGECVGKVIEKLGSTT